MEEENMYIYHLPHAERRQLCIILDQNNVWEELAGTHMKYDVTTIYVRKMSLKFCKLLIETKIGTKTGSP